MERKPDTLFIKARVRQLEARLASEIRHLYQMEGKKPPAYHKVTVVPYETVFERALREKQMRG